jgi:hypothetical protein
MISMLKNFCRASVRVGNGHSMLGLYTKCHKLFVNEDIFVENENCEV